MPNASSQDVFKKVSQQWQPVSGPLTNIITAQGSLCPSARKLAAQPFLCATGSVSLDLVAHYITGTTSGRCLVIIIPCILYRLSSHFHTPTQPLFRYSRPGHGENATLPRDSL